MSIHDAWEKAMKKTEIIRPRVQALNTFKATHIPYLFLAETTGNSNRTLIRRGEVVVEKPTLLLPFNAPHFEGFDFEDEMDVEESMLSTFFMVRGINFPSLKYAHKTDKIEFFEGPLSKAIDFYTEELQKKEDVHAGLVTGPLDVWIFSVLILVGHQISKSAESDFRQIFDDYHRKGLMS